MIKASINIQDLRRKIYIKAKADKTWRFWGLYVHVCKIETLQEAYKMAKNKNGAPGIDGITFDNIEASGIEIFLQQIQKELISGTYWPTQNRRKEIPKGDGKYRILGIPTIRDRVVQGALKLILEPIFEADFQEGSYGYRPKRNPHQAIDRVAKAVVENKTRVIDLDLRSYFDTVRHDLLLKKVAKRVNDENVMRLLKLILKASGKRGVPQGGVISPLLANLYLNEVDKMLEKAKEVTRHEQYTHIEYARFADDIVILIDAYPKWNWLEKAVYQRLLEELTKLDVQLNEEKTRIVNLANGESFGFLGFDFRRSRTRKGKWGVLFTPKMKARTKILTELKETFRRFQSQPVSRVIELINPVLRGWVNYYRVGNSGRCFGYVKDWIEKKVRRHLMRARNLKGFGWDRWSRNWLYQNLGLYSDYKIRHYKNPKALPAQ
ncbi:RNA-directed DNA polymerase (Reverse transcriptase) [Desulfofarcimen acetoxidans DSM 771]|uniref:RNA-directed DNA polymerase (Reverse transcriptase) n=1 Tax=Desulfofarcimen acetoxidans (strain ATCC 49208 / DSM 771 / KCTC 5769 / VKM B-1644 / 5575) TaxID=485916 RepID=C8VXL4_DESAS|nr:group II intron reverse transcriptase/maturase [Desulfofarcimen acetoxidans]ACV62670.1 RNA-directed DNA polymerase (Reverse transcriptase) [Desulfofarcimen acetoxidans DSM 771]